MNVVVGIGELLWDVFPQGKRLGGAPPNFACHCGQLGTRAYAVSCIGRDALGAELRETLGALSMDHAYVADDADHPTGTVQVTVDKAGKPSYEICEGVAWDMIPQSGALNALARQADAACFGSLAQRHPVSRATIQSFIAQMRPDALKIFDVNLRQAFFSKDVIERSLELSNALKLSDEELPVLAGLLNVSGSVPQMLRSIRRRFDLRLVAYTRGGEGSLLVTADETHDHPGHACEVADSVGAGDAFTAALCAGLLRRHTLAAINDHANRVAAYVCSQMGATPLLPASLTRF